MTPSFEIDFPIRCVVDGEPIPDLSKIDRARWREALLPLTHRARVRAARMTPKRGFLDPDDPMLLVTRLELEDGGRRDAARQAASFPPTQTPPRPHAESARRTTRQLNVRLSHRQFAEIERAATLLGLKPTQLARQFILTGAGRVLYEDRRREQARRRT